MLRLSCRDGPLADALDKQRGSSGSGASCLGSLAGSLEAVAHLLTQQHPHQPAHPLLQQASLELVAAACSLAGRMRPAASTGYYASLLALMLHLLAAHQPHCTAEAAGVSPDRQIVPFAAAFPAASLPAAAGGDGGSSDAEGPSIHMLLLEALRELLAGSSSQQLIVPLRFVEAALPALCGGSSRGSGAGGLALPLCELLLAVLEAGSSGARQQRLLAQHSERLAALLVGFIDGFVSQAEGTPGLPHGHQQQQQQRLGLPELARAIISAAEGDGAGAAALAATSTHAGHTATAAAAAVTPGTAPQAAEVATLCTALRALESLAARPKLFRLSPAAITSMLSSVAAIWAVYAEHRHSQQAAGATAMPGFSFRLGASGGAGLFAASCHLLVALMRHRQQVRSQLGQAPAFRATLVQLVSLGSVLH
jgi:hypothetical protein